MTKRILVFTIALLSLSFISFDAGIKQKVQIVFCIDLSTSTKGLLNDIRDNLWNFINTARINKPETDLQIGIIGFGRPGFGSRNDYVEVLCDITSDFDSVSSSLFRLKAGTEKGDQCVGSALYTAVNGMYWSRDSITKKVIYLFGNGKVNLCGYDYRKACDMAVKKNITVNTVYCNQRVVNQKEFRGWHQVASSTGGEVYTFRLTKRLPVKKFTGDSQWLVDLNNQLNDTYIYFTKEGKLQYDLMLTADADSKKMNEEFFHARCRYKISSHYQQQCSRWDLGTLMLSQSGDFKMPDNKYLPQELQNSGTEHLREVSLIKKEKRNVLLTQMQNAFDSLQQHPSFSNPMDSVFSSSVSRF